MDSPQQTSPDQAPGSDSSSKWSPFDEVPALTPSELNEDVSEEEVPSSRVGVTPQSPEALELLRRKIGHRASWSEVYQKALSVYLQAALQKGLEKEGLSQEGSAEENSTGDASSEKSNQEGTDQESPNQGVPTQEAPDREAPFEEGPPGKILDIASSSSEDDSPSDGPQS